MKTMKSLLIIFCLSLAGTIHAEETESAIKSDKIEGLTGLDFPSVQGEKCLGDLTNVLIAHLFNLTYTWTEDSVDQWNFTGRRWRTLGFDNCTDREKARLQQDNDYKRGNSVKKALIEKGLPLAFLATPLSEQDLKDAEEKGVHIVCKPIGLDATLFVNHLLNPIDNLTRLQVQKIYTSDYGNWKELGGTDIHIYNNVNMDEDYTGYFKSQLMDGKEINSKWFWEVDHTDPGCEYYHKTVIFKGLNQDKDYGDIYYTQYLFRHILYNHDWARIMKTDGIMPSRENILSGMYPYTMYIYAAVNTDRKAYPMANKIYDYLTTPEGQQMLADYCYIPLRAATEGIKQVQDMETDAEISIQNGWLTAKPSDRPRQISMNDLSGKRVAQATLQAGAVKAPLSIKPGMYLMSVSVDGKRLAVRKIVL